MDSELFALGKDKSHVDWELSHMGSGNRMGPGDGAISLCLGCQGALDERRDVVGMGKRPSGRELQPC